MNIFLLASKSRHLRRLKDYQMDTAEESQGITDGQCEINTSSKNLKMTGGNYFQTRKSYLPPKKNP